MIRVLYRTLVHPLLLLACVAALVSPARAAGNAKTIDSPGGGHVVYGPLTGVSSLRNGMGVVLRDVHTHFGDRPVIGRLIQTPERDSIATFFTLTAKRQGGTRIAGMVIVSMPRGARPAGAVLYDNAARFNRTASVLLKTLNNAWHTAALQAASASRTLSAAPSRPYPAQPLHEALFADNSGSIGMPAGWHFVRSGGGSANIAGPNGEGMLLGVIIQNIYDPRSRQAQGLMHYMDMGHNPYYVYPFGGDLVKAWITLNRQFSARHNTPAPSFEETSRQTAPHSPYEAYAILVLGNIDLHDGKGPLRSRVRLGALRPTGAQWALTLERESLPPQLVAKEWPTVVAMLNSYRQNGREIERQTQVVIDDIHARAAAANARAQAQSASNDAHNASVEAGWDQSAKYNESFENYTLDRTVVQDNETGAHGTIGYSAADSLVRSQPSRFQYVATPDYMRGIDY